MKVTVWDVTNSGCNIRDYMNVDEDTGRIYVQMEHMYTVLIDKTEEWESLKKELYDAKEEVKALSERNEFLEKAHRINSTIAENLKEERNCYREAREIIEQLHKDNFVENAHCFEDGYLDGLDTAMNIIDKALEEMK